MSELFRTNGPMILMALAAVLLIGFMAYSYLRSDEDEDEDDELAGGSTLKMSSSHAADTQELPESDDLRARKSRMIALKDSLERSLQTRGGVKSAGMDRLAMPWFMLVGTEGSGKKSLLASTGLPLPYGPPVEVDSARKDAGRWWLFEDAVVVEAPTVKPGPKALAPSDATAATDGMNVDLSEGWNNLLHLLRRERPDSPLNGIVITVSCADLVGTRRKSPEELSEQAELIRAFLDRTRRVLGMRLPVHVLITRCDILPGFRSFAETLPESRRDDIFGWSNSHPVEKAFDSKWVEDGFAEVQKSLDSLHDELLAAPESVHDADGLFVFVNEFGDLQDPLVDFISRLLPSTERKPSLFLRGVYFTGDASEKAARAATQDDAATLHISIEATEAESHSLVFLRSLFADKVFREAGLARTASPIKISRDIRVLGAQAAALVIALLGGAGLWASLYGFDRSGGQRVGAALTTRATELAHVMSGVAIDLYQLKRQRPTGDSVLDRRAQDAAVVNLITEMRSVTSKELRSPFVPSSWLSPLPGDIEQTMKSGVQDVILPIARARLKSRIDDLLGVNGHDVMIGDDLDASDPKSLASYLRNVRRLTQNVARYNALAAADSGSVRELEPLVEYLFGERLDDRTPDSTSAEFQEALREATAPALVITPTQTNAAVSRAVALIASVADSATRQLSGRAGTAPDDDLRALRRLNDLVALTDTKTGLAATMGDSTPTGRRLARAVQDSIGARLTIAAQRVLRDSLLPDQASQRLRSVLSSLFTMRLMDPVEGKSIADDLIPGSTLRWDIGQIELAFALRGELKRAEILAADALQPATQLRVRSALQTQMRDRMIDLAAGAQRFTPDTLAAMAEILALSENMQGASDRLVRLAALLDSMKVASEGRKLIVAGTRQAEHLLAHAQVVVDSAGYLAPRPAAVAAWRGGYPVGFAALGVSDTGAFELRLTREQVAPMQALAAAVTPALNYIGQPVVAGAMISSPKLVADWRGIAAAAAPGATGPTLAALYDYLTKTMGPIDQPSCQAAVLKADPITGPSDWFVTRRVQFRAAMRGRCNPGGSGDAVAAYRKLREVFGARLAGRFPFVDSARTNGAAAADPAAVREFYQLYDAFARSNEVMMRSDPRLGPGARPAFTFLDQVAQARPFFAAFIDSGSTRRTPEYGFVAEALRPGERGELSTGSQVVLLNDSTQSGSWSFGQPVRVQLPDDSSASFSSAGPWGLVELARRGKPVRLRFYHPDTKIRLALPIFPVVAPDVPGGR